MAAYTPEGVGWMMIDLLVLLEVWFIVSSLLYWSVRILCDTDLAYLGPQWIAKSPERILVTKDNKDLFEYRGLFTKSHQE